MRSQQRRPTTAPWWWAASARSPTWPRCGVHPTRRGRHAAQTEIVRTETFAPLLYVLAYDDFDEALALQAIVVFGSVTYCFWKGQLTIKEHKPGLVHNLNHKLSHQRRTQRTGNRSIYRVWAIDTFYNREIIAPGYLDAIYILRI
jgi:hypothetical protein